MASGNQRAAVRAIPNFVVGIATLVLPRGEVRQRYRDELRAELYDLPTRRQYAFAFGALTRAWRLRQAILSAEPGLAGISGISGAGVTGPKPLLCALHLHHAWRIETTEDGHHYRHCRRCGKDDDGLGRTMLVSGNMMTRS